MHMSGYPHIDKPWLKFYDKYNLELPKLNLVEYLKQKNTSRGNKIGEIYYGNTFTYDEIWNNSDIASRVLSSLGVGKGSRILSIVPNIPELKLLTASLYTIPTLSKKSPVYRELINVKITADKNIIIPAISHDRTAINLPGLSRAHNTAI